VTAFDSQRLQLVGIFEDAPTVDEALQVDLDIARFVYLSLQITDRGVIVHRHICLGPITLADGQIHRLG
jgi:hypothetical protein